MKVILSIDSIKPPLTGVGRYTLELGKGLQTSSELKSLAFLKGTAIQNELPDPEEFDGFEKTPLWKSLAHKSSTILKTQRSLKNLLANRALRDLPDHILHAPDYFLPPFSGPSIVTIHDLSVYLWSKTHPAERVRFMQTQIEKSLKRANSIITGSEYSKREIVSFFGWPENQIHVVHHGYGSEFYPRTEQETSMILARYGLSHKSYTLTTATIEPRKNLSTLVDAYSSLEQKIKTRFPLVIAGHSGWNSKTDHEKITKGISEGWLFYLGFVPNSLLPNLYAGARLFAFPSIYEGFGLPLLEAMASGTAVVSSHASSLPEVAGDAVAYHDPKDVDCLKRLLERGLTDEPWNSSLSLAGIKRAQNFSWKSSVGKTLDVYRLVHFG